MSQKIPFDVILAATRKGGIGLNGTLPWHLRKELQYFKKITNTTVDPNKQNVIIMGKNSWNAKPIPLPGRISVIVSNSMKKQEIEKFGDKAHIVNSLDTALDLVSHLRETQNTAERAFLIGGARLFEQGIQHEMCRLFYLTKIGIEVKCDTYFPDGFLKQFQHLETTETQSENDIPYCYTKYINKNYQGQYLHTGNELGVQHQEFQYLNIIKDLIDSGNVKEDRTGVGIKGKFGNLMRYDLEKSFPLLTTKRVFWKGVAEELLWFIKGSTNGNILKEKGINIWEGNGSREFLDNLGFKDREENDLGPIYGFQWRHFGAEYKDMHTNYEGQGVDQIKNLINQLKNNPDSRRHIFCAWNPSDIPKMALPPCHVLAQFYVNDGKLSCLLYQRSCDMGLGVPFNIASYGLLTCMLAQICGLKRGEFIHVLGDYHVYQNHIEPLKKQIDRIPRPFPILKINPEVKDIDGFKFEDFELLGYDPYPGIKMEMAV
ncbi:Thymidylate synthase/dCMP hydroxymethylase domain [Pseudocohnilembus persalinus]|uniref:Bifunctional dihydrofolate reductase-thymidylate synthase n=1 Tax=Pseudocohnilembus persalinus TaxID=266149 RepID=A0A0V0R1W3_PSEPJ|nr:Thymidylate synthase/dCMP hydroxymethylase domain [Pseudocohnilembus persalinus]|eukprot:KRX08365.1 Thymidylate synthase/dCMP hydroxymethylase domain [Pseudocohnilembus persalinus]